MSLFFEIKVRINGEERWADARKMFDYLYKDCVDKNYKGNGEIPLNSEEMNQEFMKWWDLYNKKTDKKKTQKYWISKIKPKDYDKIINHTKNYVESNEKQFRKNPHSYLLNESYENEIIVTNAEKEEHMEKARLEKKNDFADSEWAKTLAMRTPEQIKKSEHKSDLQTPKQKKHEEEVITESFSHKDWTNFVKNTKKNLGKK